ncbi:DUF2147 domain-containing protein [Alysiella crassa]|uniref:Uncharacterized protein conserved in bacteria n=1 Tax=Alysiella crassa TaxID=153491 RepID=A0A376BLJ5_9NEIS|nr:DUF2147 domain-containing protein [Alysiella crassa]UOP07189.1 DUF2147 domain-containing protein [Alysiella crassa]SSY70647.1 Uncharacterized protein conserved in bacteria [Alysiella crassa]
MKRTVLAAVLVLSTLTASAADINGRWQNFDDKDGKPKAIIAINGSTGSVVGVAKGVDPNCPSCKKPGSLVGRTILWNLKPDGANEYEGKIHDPKSGRTYSAHVTVNGNSLKVCGYIGLRFAGRCQTWKRV